MPAGGASPDPALEVAVGLLPRLRRGSLRRLMEQPTSHTAVGLTADGRFRSGKLAGLTMWSAIWVLCWPYVVESFLNSMVGITDTVLAAGLADARVPDAGRHATDAIGAASYVGWLLGLVVMSVGMGATALVSRSVGKRRQAVADRTVAQALTLALVGTSAVSVAVALSAPWSAGLFQLEPAARTMYVQYLGIVSMGTPLMAVLLTGSACARGAGDSKRPLLAMALVNVVNVVASWVLSGVDLRRASVVDGEIVSRVVVHNPFDFDLGVLGIAWGTFIASGVGAAFMLWLLRSGVSGVRLRWHRLRPERIMQHRLFRLGWPGFLEAVGMWAGNFIVVLMVADLMAGGLEGALGAHMVGIRIEAFSFMPGFAISIAASTLVGQYLGAGSVAMAQLAVVRCCVLAMGVMGAIGVLFVVFPTAIVSVFTQVPAHLEQVPKLAVVFGMFQIPFALSLVMRSALRGSGDVRAAMWITWITTYAVRVPMVWAMSGVDIRLERFGFGAAGSGGPGVVIENPFHDSPSLWLLWVALFVEIAVRAALFTIRFAQGHWKRTRV